MGFHGSALMAVYAISAGAAAIAGKRAAAAWRSPCPRRWHGATCSPNALPRC